jgi:PTS system nitrogen regulatory IIA component
MRLSEIFVKEHIISELRANDKAAVLEELAEVITVDDSAIHKDDLVHVLLDRERLGSTGIGDGVAIPHGKLEGLRKPVISFGRSTKGLPFDAMDGQPVHLFFLLVAPENSSGIHLQALAKIAKILKNSHFRKKLIETESRDGLYQAILEADEES